jgi:hypothetical protein
MLVCFASQKRPARLCFSKQSVYELGTLAFRIVTGSAVSAAGADLTIIPDTYPLKLHALLPRLVAMDPGNRGGGGGSSFVSELLRQCMFRIL